MITLFTRHALRMALRLVICILAAALTLIQSLYWIAFALTMLFVAMTGIPLLTRTIGTWLRLAFWDNGLRPLAWAIGHTVTPPSWVMSSLVIPPPMCDSWASELLYVEPQESSDVPDISPNTFIELWEELSATADVGMYEENEDDALPPPQSPLRDSAIATLDLPEWALYDLDAALPDATIELPAVNRAMYRGVETGEGEGVQPLDYEAWCHMWSPTQRGKYRDV